MTSLHRICCQSGLFVAVVVASMTTASAQMALGPAVCGPLKPPGQFGPFDYRTVAPEPRTLVESAHFTQDVELLRRGNTGATPARDLDYTLRALPNSPRALMTVTRYSLKLKTMSAVDMRYSFECYFERAIRWTPNDPMPHLIYAKFLQEHQRNGEARAQLDQAEQLRGDLTNFDFDYNLGLLYFDIGEYDKSAVAAKRAYELGAPFPSLMTKLKQKGKWIADQQP